MRFERRLKAQTTVDLTPLIDVVFQLVIFFMVASVFKTAPGIPLDLPASGTPEAVAVNELRIKVVSQDQIYVNFTLTDPKGLDKAIAVELDKTPETSAILEADKNVPYQTIMEVLDALRRNQILDVGMISAPGSRSP